MLRPVPLTLPPGVPPQSGSEGQDGRNRTCGFFSAEGVRNKSPHPLVISPGGHWPSAPVGKAGRPWGGADCWRPTGQAKKGRAAGPPGKLNFIPSSLLNSRELPCQPFQGGELLIQRHCPHPRPHPLANNEDSGKAAGLSAQ